MVKVFDRSKKEIYEEEQYGQKKLEFLYNTVIGRIILKLIISNKIYSKINALFEKRKSSIKKIKPFVKKYNIIESDFEEKQYNSFNDFFTRKIKEGARKIEKNKSKLIAPADSKLSVYKIDHNLKVKIKNSVYSINELLKDEELSKEYIDGICLIYRLSVDDYHRYCYIDNGTNITNKTINGKLHTVSSISKDYRVYKENQREYEIQQTENLGKIVYMEVGAMQVGKINNYKIESFTKGQEKGYFEFGGSTIIILIQKETVQIDDDIMQMMKKRNRNKSKIRRKCRDNQMIKRLRIYFKEMYPIIPRLILGFIVFLEIHFIILLNYGVKEFSIGIQELIGGFTVFSFLMLLRIADDFKDYETDLKLFKERPLPSGRVHKKDLWVCLIVITTITFVLNIIFMNNIAFFLFLYLYGFLMSMWFFQKSKIQKSLPLALVTHNPVQMVVNVYIISFTCIKYGLNWCTLTCFLAAWTLYFPALIWEIARKIKAPKDENEYTTYSKLFGYKKATRFIAILTIVDIITNIILVYNLNIFSVFALILNVIWMTDKFIIFSKNPEKFKIVDKVERYTYIQESIMLITIVIYLVFGKI